MKGLVSGGGPKGVARLGEGEQVCPLLAGHGIQRGVPALFLGLLQALDGPLFRVGEIFLERSAGRFDRRIYLFRNFDQLQGGWLTELTGPPTCLCAGAVKDGAHDAVGGQDTGAAFPVEHRRGLDVDKIILRAVNDALIPVPLR